MKPIYLHSVSVRSVSLTVLQPPMKCFNCYNGDRKLVIYQAKTMEMGAIWFGPKMALGSGH